MTYKKADDVLPAHLLAQVKVYMSQGLLYIPAEGDSKKGWGQQSGSRASLDERNRLIGELHATEHLTVPELADRFCLSESAIRKILVHRKQ